MEADTTTAHADSRETGFTPGPWEWYDFGNDWCLVSRTPHVPVVLAANDDGRITTRDGRGVLQPITKDHPNARLIALSPDLYADALALLTSVAPLLPGKCHRAGADTYAHRQGTCVWCNSIEAAARLRATLAKAPGGQS